MKRYQICLAELMENEKGKKYSKSSSLTITLEARNVQSLFNTLRKDYPRYEIFWVDLYGGSNDSFYKGNTKCIFNKFFYVDKKTGKLKEPKLIFDYRKNEYVHSKYYINNNSLKMKFNYLTNNIKQGLKTKTYLFRKVVETELIKNGLLKQAIALNEKRQRMYNETFINNALMYRALDDFSLLKHLREQDPTGATKGCGCKYCESKYFYERSKEMERKLSFIIPFRRSDNFQGSVTVVINGETISNFVPLNWQALVTRWAKVKNLCNKYEAAMRIYTKTYAIPSYSGKRQQPIKVETLGIKIAKLIENMKGELKERINRLNNDEETFIFKARKSHLEKISSSTVSILSTGRTEREAFANIFHHPKVVEETGEYFHVLDGYTVQRKGILAGSDRYTIEFYKSAKSTIDLRNF